MAGSECTLICTY